MHHVLLWCVCFCVGVCTVFSSQTGWCPLTFESIVETCVLPPANDTPGGVQWSPSPHLETFKLLSPRQHTTTSRCTKTKNTTFSNVIMLVYVSVKLVHSHPFSSRRGGNYICICVSLCGVVMPQIYFFGGVGGCFGASWEGRWSEDCHITPVFLIVSTEGLLSPSPIF